MLGYLLFAGALHINAIELRKNVFSVLYLASIGVITSTVLTGFILWYISNIFNFNLQLSDCLIFGAIISPTDPIAVMSFFKGTKKSLGHIKVKITGEALFNDAVSILLLVILVGVFYNKNFADFSINNIGLSLVQEVAGGITWGIFLGYAASYFLARTDDNEATILITIAVASTGYIIANYLHVSGPITMIISGLLIGSFAKKQRFSIKTSNSLNQFWSLVDGILNAFLFVLIGLEFLTIDINLSAAFISVIGLFIIFIARLASILLLNLFKVKHIVQSNNLLVMWKESFILCWGGVRGAISIALALATPGLPPYLIGITYLIVIMSILLQGSTLKLIMNRLIK
jgi:CPA1 family monovalent cation:H+ antiporter